MKRAILTLLSVLALASPSHAVTVCNPPPGWLLQNGNITTGDLVQFGPNCGELSDAGSGFATLPITAPNINYTAPGTGGVTSTQQAYDQRVLWAQDYGAACNGVTNDTTALQNLINEAITLGAPARITGGAGGCVTNNLTVSGSIDFGGVYGTSNLLFNSGQGFILTGSAGLYFHDFNAAWPAGETTSNGFSQSGSNTLNAPKFQRIYMSGPAIGYNLVRMQNGTISDGSIVNIPNGGKPFVVDNTSNCNGVGVSINNMWFSALATAASGGNYLGGGGTRITQNRWDGPWANGLIIDLDAGCLASDLEISNNSFQGLTSGSSGLLIVRAANTATLFNLNILNNSFASPGAGINVATDASGAWINNLNIVGNSVSTPGSGTPVCYSVDSVNGFSIGYNSCAAGVSGTKKIAIGASANSCVVGPVAGAGTFAASVGGSCTTIAPF